MSDMCHDPTGNRQKATFKMKNKFADLNIDGTVILFACHFRSTAQFRVQHSPRHCSHSSPDIISGVQGVENNQYVVVIALQFTNTLFQKPIFIIFPVMVRDANRMFLGLEFGMIINEKSAKQLANMFGILHSEIHKFLRLHPFLIASNIQYGQNGWTQTLEIMDNHQREPKRIQITTMRIAQFPRFHPMFN